MSSKIEVIRVCEHCKKEFVAKTTVTRFCSHKCNSRAYKERIKNLKVEVSKKQTEKKEDSKLEVINSKEILTVKEVSILLNCSVRSVYYYIEQGTISAFNIGERLTRVKRSEIDKMFVESEPETVMDESENYDISDCYSINEVILKYNISSGALYNLIKRNKIPKIKEGKFVYVPKVKIEALLS
ncbi:helix-turn-helix domain-containing protein [Aestuariibaculum sp. M13]|uniref:helix-turn-helix domain-containing protein n=1 Tax=Aestuariibaculum sp. M13 TaxID=2967132 RepID=UPI002159ECF7|nr:helix-turn-helix domain-containing protein [Aestuariibaculum sp. M13]MCR8667899.1 helix-turn-helix domain-containing protein [Aestuariibaculum sp. M13]